MLYPASNYGFPHKGRPGTEKLGKPSDALACPSLVEARLGLCGERVDMAMYRRRRWFLKHTTRTLANWIAWVDSCMWKIC